MLGRFQPDGEQLQALEAVKDWTRRRFKLAEDAVVLVAEIVCRRPNCPPLETAVAFWTDADTRHQFKLLKPVREVIYDDIGWLFGTPESHQGWECC